MSGHRHNPSAATQNQGNSLGDRACVRQSKLYRVHESGNDVKALLGTAHLCWDTNQKQGAYAGHKVYDHTEDDPLGVHHIHAAAQEQHKYSRARGPERKDGGGNFYSGYSNENETDYRRGPIAGKAEPRRQSGGGQFETTSSGYGRETTDRIGKYGQGDDGYRGGGGYERRTNDYDYEQDQEQGRYGRRASYDREPQNGARRSSFHNDENVYSEKNKLSHYSGGGNGYEGPNKYKDDRNYRNMREQMDNSSSYQRAQPQPEVERTTIRTYRGKDKDTRPW
jgi:hypothetical protein